MAATNYTPIQLYYSATAAAVPVNTNLASGELAINITDGKLYYKNNAGTVTLLSSAAGASGDVVGPSSATANSIALFNSTTGKLIKDSSASDGLIYGLTVGRGAGAVATNTAVGTSALAANSTGTQNTAIGYQAGFKTTGGSNTFVGIAAGYENTTGVSNTAVGTAALMNGAATASSGSYNTAIGQQALNSNTTASNNTAVGYQSIYTNTTGAELTAIGNQALQKNTTANWNIAVGSYALRETTTGSSNTAIGYSALQLTTTASNNTAVGYQAGYSNQTGASNTFVGQTAGYSTTGGGNTFVGATVGSVGAGYFVTTGTKNTIIGGFHGNQGGLDIRTGSNFIVLSDGDGNPRLYNAGSYYWSLVGTSASTCGAILFRNSSQTQYWNMEAADTNWYVFGTSTYVYFAQGGSSWVFSSDRRIKENIVDIDYGLDAVMQLKPRRYDNTTNEKNEIGFVAQELREVIPEAVTGEEIEFDENDTKMERAKKSLGVSKDTLIPVLVKAIQELKAEVDSLKAQINGASA